MTVASQQLLVRIFIYQHKTKVLPFGRVDIFLTDSRAVERKIRECFGTTDFLLPEFDNSVYERASALLLYKFTAVIDFGQRV